MCTSHVPHFLGNLFLTEKIAAYSMTPMRSLTVRETSNKMTHAPFNRLFRDDFLVFAFRVSTLSFLFGLCLGAFNHILGVALCLS